MVVLVTDGDQRASLAITRSLGKKGVEVVIGESFSPNLSNSSKYCSASITYASPIHNSSKFKMEMINTVKGGYYQVLVPVTDVTLALLSQVRPLVTDYVQLPIPEAEAVEAALNKEETYRRAQSLGLPIPTTYFINDLEQIYRLAPQLSYPVVIKPRYSWMARENRWVKAKVQYAFNEQELIDTYIRSHNLIPLPMLQELIVGPGCGIFVLMNRGEPRACFAHLRLREKPPWGGESVLRESVPLDPVMQDYALRLLKSLNWHGVAMVEFKQDQLSRIPKLMEINGRFWGSLQLAIDAGINFPYLLYQMVLQGDIEPPKGYQVGIKSRWLLGDLESLILTLWQAKSFSWLPRKGKALADFIRPSKSHYEILSWDDPKPWIIEILRCLKKIRSGHGKKFL